MLQGIHLIRFVLLVIGLLAGGMCIYFGTEVHTDIYRANGLLLKKTADSGLEGAALGMGILGGLSFVALAITFLRKY